MLLAVDVGNTQTVLGLFDASGGLTRTWRTATDRSRTAQEWAVLWRGLLALDRLEPDAARRLMIGSVVPPVGEVWEEVGRDLLGVPVAQLTPEVRHGLVLEVDQPGEVGADRIANAIAARELFGTPAVVVDFGTATTFDVVSAAGHYLGGAIAPGLWTAAEALVQKTARLPRIALEAPRHAIGRNTVAAMQSGIVYGFAGQVDALVERLARELEGEPRVLATGGLAPLVARHSRRIDQVVPELTLLGLGLVAGALGLVDWRVRR
jgi:type III pantothenate kinase